MASPFQDAALKASVAVDEVYGEPFEVRPMTQGGDVNAPVSADPSRPVMTVTAAYIDVFARVDSGAVRTPGVTAERPGFSTLRPQMSLAQAALPYLIRTGDRVKRLSSGQVYRISEVRRDGVVRTLADLNLV